MQFFLWISFCNSFLKLVFFLHFLMKSEVSKLFSKREYFRILLLFQVRCKLYQQQPQAQKNVQVNQKIAIVKSLVLPQKQTGFPIECTFNLTNVTQVSANFFFGHLWMCLGHVTFSTIFRQVRFLVFYKLYTRHECFLVRELGFCGKVLSQRQEATLETGQTFF